MAVLAERQDENISVRISPSQKARFEEAAAIRGVKLSELVKEATEKEADRVIREAENKLLDRTVFLADKKILQELKKVLDAPAAPSDQLARLMAKKTRWE